MTDFSNCGYFPRLAVCILWWGKLVLCRGRWVSEDCLGGQIDLMASGDTSSSRCWCFYRAENECQNQGLCRLRFTSYFVVPSSVALGKWLNYPSLFPLLRVYNRDAGLYRTHSWVLSSGVVQSSAFLLHKYQAGKIWSLWVCSADAQGLTGRASFSVILEEDGDCPRLEEWSCWVSACAGSNAGGRWSKCWLMVQPAGGLEWPTLTGNGMLIQDLNERKHELGWLTELDQLLSQEPLIKRYFSGGFSKKGCLLADSIKRVPMPRWNHLYQFLPICSSEIQPSVAQCPLLPKMGLPTVWPPGSNLSHQTPPGTGD